MSRPGGIWLPDYSFAGLSWLPKPDRSGYLSRFDGEFKLRKNVVYYFGAQMHAERMAQVYAALAKTNFPSLYAATTPGDDFAESFASYVHTVLANRPWEILLSKEGTETARIGACWNEPRCLRKTKVPSTRCSPSSRLQPFPPARSAGATLQCSSAAATVATQPEYTQATAAP